MAEVEEPQFTTLAERIAALNKQKAFHAPAPPAVAKKPHPPPPPHSRPPQNRSSPQPAVPPTVRRDLDVAPAPTSPSLPPRPSRPAARDEGPRPPPLPRRTTATTGQDAEAPQLPRRTTAPSPNPLDRSAPHQPSPALPPRRPSAQTLPVRRNSNSSDVSYLSTVSNLSLPGAVSDKHARRILALAPDQARLPSLSPSRRGLEATTREALGTDVAAQSAQARPALPARPGSTNASDAQPPRPSLPPRLPSRPGRPVRTQASEQDEPTPVPALPARRMPSAAQVPSRIRSALEWGFPNKSKAKADDGPPPVPASSRPRLSQAGSSSNHAPTAAAAAAARPSPAPSAPCCLVCRDFSGPDSVAARHPAQTLPRHDPVGHLAHVLCDPFPSTTDKARAIFTWCHHNIAYDAEGFFGGTVRYGQGAADIISSGKAVCEGYAKVYHDVANRAGLECIVVTGHGKGYGFHPLAAGQAPPPRDPTGHAWNAVRIDGGEWKLVDACWGAGALADGSYNKRFAAEMFYLPNDIFGLKHFPSDDRWFFRSDGGALTWEEYITGPVRGEPATWYGVATEEGLNEFTFSPREKHIPVRGGDSVRFQFSKVCEHWDPVRNGRGEPYLLLMKIHGPGGAEEDFVPLDTNGFWWWADIPATNLGAPGQTVTLLGLDTLDGRPARGVTKEEFLAKLGRCGMSWVGIAAWDLV